MAFSVLNTIALDRFARKHRDAAAPLADWLNTVRAAEWRSLLDVRRVFASADGISVRVTGGEVVVVTVFNIKGNHYRLLAILNYDAAVCRVIEVLTHAEYTAGRWKDEYEHDNQKPTRHRRLSSACPRVPAAPYPRCGRI